MKEVFDFLEIKDSMYSLTGEAKKRLSASKSSLIISIMGDMRSGKSTRLNQLVTGIDVSKMKPSGPFKAAQGGNSVTKHFQAYEIKLSQLNENLGISSNLSLDSDVFLVDSEGLGDFEGSQFLKKGLLALQQIAGVTIYLFGSMPNGNTFRFLKDHIGLSHMILGTTMNIETGLVMMAREVGVVEGLEDEEQSRRKEDEDKKKLYISKFEEQGIEIIESNFMCLIQPTFNEVELYRNSMRDLVEFINVIHSKRSSIDGKMLIDMFNMVSTMLKPIKELDQVNVPLDQIINEIIDGIIDDAFNEVIHFALTTIHDFIFEMNKDQMRQVNISQRIMEFQNSIHPLMIEKVKQRNEYLIEHVPEKINDKNQMIHDKIPLIFRTEWDQKLDGSLLFPHNWTEYLMSEKVTDVAPGTVITLFTQDNRPYQLRVIGRNCYRIPSIEAKNRFVEDRIKIYELHRRKTEDFTRDLNYTFDPMTFEITVHGGSIKREHEQVFLTYVPPIWRRYWYTHTAWIKSHGPFHFVGTNLRNACFSRKSISVGPNGKESFGLCGKITCELD